jgi:hypothetical protein
MTEILLKVVLTPSNKIKQNKTNKQINNKKNEQALQLYHQFDYKINVHITGLLLSSEMCAKYKINTMAQVFTFTCMRITC